jgi:hypothetical protein
MKSSRLFYLGSLSIFGVACVSNAVDYRAAQQAGYAAAMGKPSHAPTTAAQWAELDARATALAREGTTATRPTERLANQGFSVDKRFGVRGGHCYLAALAWSFDRPASASINFQSRDDGQLVNDFVGGARRRLESRGGVLRFCADRDGEALLTVSAVQPSGTIANNELLEYAFALGEKPESEGEATARRAQEQAAGARSQARIDANIARAEERERRDLEDRCRRCREEYRLCQVETAYRRQHPRPGVHVSTSCESKFGVCAMGKYSGKREDMQQCGSPPP